MGILKLPEKQRADMSFEPLSGKELGMNQTLAPLKGTKPARWVNQNCG